MDKNRTWFVNLMNNFWSLPKIQDGMHQMSVPAHFTITFTELPPDNILVVDYIIQNENGIPDPHVIDGKPGLSKQKFKRAFTNIYVAGESNLFLICGPMQGWNISVLSQI